MTPTAPVGEALSLPPADGIERNVEWGQLPAATPWLPPGEAVSHDGTSEPAGLTDEGRRQVGQEMQLDEWYLFQFSPFNVLLWRF